MPITYESEIGREDGIQSGPSSGPPVTYTLFEHTVTLVRGDLAVAWERAGSIDSWVLVTPSGDRSPLSNSVGSIHVWYANEDWGTCTLRCIVTLTSVSAPWTYGLLAHKFSGFINTVDEDDPNDLERHRVDPAADDAYADFSGSPPPTPDSTDAEELVLSLVHVLPVHTFPTPPAVDAVDIEPTPADGRFTPISRLTFTSGHFVPLGDPYDTHDTLAPFYIITTVTDDYGHYGTLPDEFHWKVSTFSLRKLADFGEPDIEPPWPPGPSHVSLAIDIAATHAGKHISYRVDETVISASTIDEGASWYYAVVAADADLSSVPTIAADHRDNLYLAYHIAGGGVRIHLSTDLGGQWTLWRVIPSVYWPRMAFAHDRAYIALWAADTLDVYESEDYLATTALALSFPLGAQLVDLGIDRRGGRYVVYSSLGTVYRRLSANGTNWGAAAAIAVGNRPAWGLFHCFAVLYWWQADVLYGRRFTSDFQAPLGSPIAITNEIVPQPLGFTVDRRDNPWVVWVYIIEPEPTPPDPPAQVYFGTVPDPGPGQFTTANPTQDLPELGFSGPHLDGYGNSFDLQEE